MTKTVLVIDDDLITMYLNKIVLASASFCDKIVEAFNGEEALSYFENIEKGDIPMDNLPEVILLDLNMPVMDGWEFFENFVQKFPEFAKKTNIFVLSSTTSPKDQERALKDPNIAAFLAKPLDEDEHFNIIKSFLNNQ
nr:response regulator [uncultured Flavobacterium sp.]